MIRFTDIINENEYVLVDGLYVFTSDHSLRHLGSVDVGQLDDTCPYCGTTINEGDYYPFKAGWYWCMYECGTMVARYDYCVILGTSAPGPLCLPDPQDDVI